MHTVKEQRSLNLYSTRGIPLPLESDLLWGVRGLGPLAPMYLQTFTILRATATGRWNDIFDTRLRICLRASSLPAWQGFEMICKEQYR
jgi:hypothetical protein